MKWVVAILIVLAVALIAWLAAIHPGVAPVSSAVFAINASVSSNGLPTKCRAIISNASPCNIEYYGGGEIFLAIYTNGDWGQVHIHTLDSCFNILPPNHSVTNIFEVPEGVTKFKVGFPLTSLTWRGNMGWNIATDFPSGSLKFLSGFLLQQDQDRRSKWEWSDECSNASTVSKATQ
jgi:hypothetical protein